MRWRVALVAVVAAAVFGGFVPHGVLSGAESSARAMVQVAESPLAQPLSCADATCGKGTPAAPAPTPTVGLAAVLAGAVIVAAGRGLVRRRRASVAALPVGTRGRLFRPPRYSE